MSRNGRAALLSPLLVCLWLTACAADGVRDRNGDVAPDGEGQKAPEDLYLQLAVEYLRQGQAKTALTKAEHALAEDPDNPQAHSLIALIYQRLRRPSLAERHFRAATDRPPKDPYILNAYASFLCDRGRFAVVRSRYEQALAVPGYAMPWVALTNLGTCTRLRMERWLGARARADTYGGMLCRCYPDSPEATQL